MPSSFLSKDMRTLRSERYTPEATREVRNFIEESLGEHIRPGDLLEALKDGIVLCRLVNLAVPGSLRFKTKASMPFVQMENISLFLEACKNYPFQLQSHDIFLTVDLYESKDPAQVLQCLGAFSRAVHKIDPVRFPNPIGSRSRISPQSTGTLKSGNTANSSRDTSNSSGVSTTKYKNTRPILLQSKTGDSSSGGRLSPVKSVGSFESLRLRSLDNKSSESAISPPWSVVQYGYMGGASQGTLGVSFGGRRQITSAGPYVPSLLEKEKKRKEIELEKERGKREEVPRLEAEILDRRPHKYEAPIEERSHIYKDQKCAVEAESIRRIKSLKEVEEQQKWGQKELQWRHGESHQREGLAAEIKPSQESELTEGSCPIRQEEGYLSRRQLENIPSDFNGNPESNRVRELERELELAREREREYERDRRANYFQQTEKLSENQDFSARPGERISTGPYIPTRSHEISHKKSQESWRLEEQKKKYGKSLASKSTSDLFALSKSQSPNLTPQIKPSRPLPELVSSVQIPRLYTGSRPLPDPANYKTVSNLSITQSDGPVVNHGFAWQTKASSTCNPNQKSDFGIPNNEFKMEQKQKISQSSQVKASNWAVKGLLEREMEMERQRQREWEEGQRELKGKLMNNEKGVDGIGGGLDGPWYVSQWTGYMGGDSQNKCTQGISNGRRQIVGPRPPPTSR